MGTFKLRGATPDKAVDKCIVKIEESTKNNRASSDLGNDDRIISFENRLVVSIHQKAGVVKTYKMIYEETDTLHAIYDKSTCTNRFVIDPRLLKDTISHFPRQLDEISLLMTEENVLVRSWASGALISDSNLTYGDDQSNKNHRSLFGSGGVLAGDANRIMQTELIMESEEFDLFVVESNQKTQTQNSGVPDFLFTELTFGLREFKSILQYAEAANAPLQAFFDNGGDPILISISEDQFDINNGINTNVLSSSRRKKRKDNTNGYYKSNSYNNNTISNEICIEGVNAEFVLATVSDPSLTNSNTSQSSIQSIKRIVRQYAESQALSQNRTRTSPDKLMGNSISQTQTQTQTQPISPSRKIHKLTQQDTNNYSLLEGFLPPSITSKRIVDDSSVQAPFLQNQNVVNQSVKSSERLNISQGEPGISNLHQKGLKNIANDLEKTNQDLGKSASSISNERVGFGADSSNKFFDLASENSISSPRNIQNDPIVQNNSSNSNRQISNVVDTGNNNIQSQSTIDASDSLLRTPNSLNHSYGDRAIELNTNVSNLRPKNSLISKTNKTDNSIDERAAAGEKIPIDSISSDSRNISGSILKKRIESLNISDENIFNGVENNLGFIQSDLTSNGTPSKVFTPRTNPQSVKPVRKRSSFKIFSSDHSSQSEDLSGSEDGAESDLGATPPSSKKLKSLF
ncbi:Cell cycle checkpoint control protein RAD9B [Smittium mucronatum]|uniref:Cell cycle checkpoint control protein RAD9B n=1 Tax=Smittium mucronatum TaxID=133383 RepID=A0A1R0GZZ1_9FUNG|nr:Cell cycle checkpoint control protein RAD9B [Smittium mucronatum]